MFRAPQPRSTLLKCIFCRRDKRKCLPRERIWPDRKCDACVHYGFDCSENLNARDQSEYLAANQSTSQLAHHEWANHTSDGYAYLPLYSTPTNHALARSTETTDLSMRLKEVYFQIWCDLDTFQGIASTKFGRTIAELGTMVLQIAHLHPIVFHSIIVFCGASAANYINGTVALNLEALWRSHLARVLTCLHRINPVQIGILYPLQCSLILLICHAISANDITTMRVCVSLLQQSQVDCSAVPISVELFAPSQDNWYLRLYLNGDPSDPGLIFNTPVNSSFRHAIRGANRTILGIRETELE